MGLSAAYTFAEGFLTSRITIDPHLCVCVLGLRTRKVCPSYEAVWAKTDVLL